LKRAILLFILLIAHTGCFSVLNENKNGSNSNSSTLTTSSPNWNIKDVRTIKYILTDNLGLSPQNTDEAPIFTRLEQEAEALGRSNFAQQKSHTPEADSIKFKTLAEIYGKACWYAMNKPQVIEKYFPQMQTTVDAGTIEKPTLFDSFYLGFLGRKPSAGEIEVLKKLGKQTMQNNTGEDPSLVARRVRSSVCMTVLTSLEGALGR